MGVNVYQISFEILRGMLHRRWNLHVDLDNILRRSFNTTEILLFSNELTDTHNHLNRLDLIILSRYRISKY